VATGRQCRRLVTGTATLCWFHSRAVNNAFSRTRQGNALNANDRAVYDNAHKYIIANQSNPSLVMSYIQNISKVASFSTTLKLALARLGYCYRQV
jgi:hypothetical protein